MTILSRFQLTGKAAIVTGAGQGIGKSIAQALAEAGASVVVADKNRALAGDVEREMREMGRQATAFEVDVRQSHLIKEMVQKCVDAYGRVDILVNNAGGTFAAPALELTESAWDSVIGFNLKSAFLCSKEAARRMLEQVGGCILNLSSISGIGPSPLAAHYGAAKAGVANLTRTLAVEWAPRIRVNAVAPGLIATPGVLDILKDEARATHVASEIPLARAGQPEDVAAVALFLVSDASAYITGEVIEVNGGPNVPLHKDPRRW